MPLRRHRVHRVQEVDVRRDGEGPRPRPRKAPADRGRAAFPCATSWPTARAARGRWRAPRWRRSATLSGSDDRPDLPSRGRRAPPQAPSADVPLRLDVFEGPSTCCCTWSATRSSTSTTSHREDHEQYLAYLDLMQGAEPRGAGEFLVMASTARPHQVEVAAAAPRGRGGGRKTPRSCARSCPAPDRVRAVQGRRAARLGERPVLGAGRLRSRFPREEIRARSSSSPSCRWRTHHGLQDALARMPAGTAQEFFVERITIADAIAYLLDRLKEEGSIKFGGHRRALPVERTRSYPFFWASSSWSASRRFACTRRTRWG